MYKIILSVILVILAAVLFPSPTLAEDLDINNIQLSTITAPYPINQAMVELQFEIPVMFDTTSIAFAELLISPLYALQNGLPMTLGCAPIIFDEPMNNATFGNIRDSLGLYVSKELLATASTADSICDTMRFDITDIVRDWVQDSLDNRGLLVFPLERRTHISGLNTGTNPPIVRIKY
jgi:hypothetical protein